MHLLNNICGFYLIPCVKFTKNDCKYFLSKVNLSNFFFFCASIETEGLKNDA